MGHRPTTPGRAKALSGPGRSDARLIMLPTRVEDGVLSYVNKEHPET